MKQKTKPTQNTFKLTKLFRFLCAWCELYGDTSMGIKYRFIGSTVDFIFWNVCFLLKCHICNVALTYIVNNINSQYLRQMKMFIEIKSLNDKSKQQKQNPKPTQFIPTKSDCTSWTEEIHIFSIVYISIMSNRVVCTFVHVFLVAKKENAGTKSNTVIDLNRRKSALNVQRKQIVTVDWKT